MIHLGSGGSFTGSVLLRWLLVAGALWFSLAVYPNGVRPAAAAAAPYESVSQR
jgi:hypothetical protein